MTGLDFSTASVEQARALAGRHGTEIDHHVADVYDAVEVLGAEAYDVVYTGHRRAVLAARCGHGPRRWPAC